MVPHVKSQARTRWQMADGTDGRDHPSCPEFVEMTEYAGINLGLQPKILGKKRKEKKRGLHSLN